MTPEQHPLETLPEVTAQGLLLIGDPHVAGTPPGHRLEGYTGQILAKLAAALARAAELDLAPVILGDLFHWPRDNPNALLVALIDLFSPVRPWVLVGNHDTFQARLTADCSISVLAAAGAIRMLDAAGPAFMLRTPQGRALVGASPEYARLPHRFEPPAGCEADCGVLWLAHHNIGFPDHDDPRITVREIPGVDWLINGHIHRPQETQRAGQTRWANPGNISRLVFSPHAKTRQPACAIWRPGLEELESWAVPMAAFETVFPDQPFPEQQPDELGESLFLQGLERLAWRRTREGQGLKEFLEANLNPEQDESALIWRLYEEVTRGRER